MADDPRDADEDNPDFRDCAGCGGEFYKGDLNGDDLCADCADEDELND